MTYEIQPLAFDPTSLNGLSAKLIGSHHLNNYGGAVRRLNAIRSELTGLDWSSTPGYRINGIKREELIAANSAFLHELYFQTLGAGDSLKPGGLDAWGRRLTQARRLERCVLARLRFIRAVVQ